MDDLTDRILKYNEGRIEKIVGLKYEGMAESMFRFFRATNHLFYEDLASDHDLPESPLAWTSGDLHIENFGSYKSDNRLVYFDLNDFDEGFLAPLLWDVYRMVVSILIAFASLGIDDEKAKHMGKVFIKTYAETLSKGKADYIEPQTAQGIVAEFLAAASRRKQKHILAKKTVERKDKLEILLDDPRHIELKKTRRHELIAHITHWLKNDSDSPYNYKVEDAVFRIAGTASIGIARYAILLKSLNKRGEKYLLLDMKEAVPSTLTRFARAIQPSWPNEADRIVSIQRRMQNRPPALLSTTIFNGKPFVIQEIQPAKDKINFNLIKKEYRSIYRVIADMASLAAYAHLRSSGRDGSAPAGDLIAFGADTGWQASVLERAVRYSPIMENYYNTYLRDYHNGVYKTSAAEILKISA